MTKIICLLCVLLFVCLVQGDISNSLDQEIQEVKISAERVVDDLINFKTIFYDDTVNSLENGNEKIIQETKSSFNNSLEEIRKAVNAANAQGKDANICFTNARNSFQNAIFDSQKKLSSYKENTTLDFKPLMDPVESEIKQAENITFELDMVNLICFSLNSTEHTACVEERFKTYRTIVDDLKKRHELRQLQEQTLVSNARRIYQSLYEEIEKNIEPMIGNVKLSASKCLKNALSPAITTTTTTIKPFAFLQSQDFWKAMIIHLH